MSLTGDNITTQDVHGLGDSEYQRIIDFLQGAVYCWCNNHEDEWFKASTFLGGDNYYWQETPMVVLYDMQSDDDKDSDKAIAKAGASAGRLLKQVLESDKRTFETREGFPAREYRWTGN